VTTSTEELSANRVVFRGWLPAQEAADRLGVSREYIYRLKAIYDEGGAGIPGFLLGEEAHVLMFRISDLDAYARAHPDLSKPRTRTTGQTQEAGEEDDADETEDLLRAPAR
jgi:hypothetical protein